MKAPISSLLLLLIMALLPKSGSAQVYIGLDGLTCSMWSNRIYNSLRKMDGVKEVKMDLNENIAEVIFKKDNAPNYSKLSQGVYDAGFSVRFIKDKITLPSSMVKFGTSYIVNENKYIYIGQEDKTTEGEMTISLIGKGFLARKDLKKFESTLKTFKNTSIGHTYYFIF